MNLKEITSVWISCLDLTLYSSTPGGVAVSSIDGGLHTRVDLWNISDTHSPIPFVTHKKRSKLVWAVTCYPLGWGSNISSGHICAWLLSMRVFLELSFGHHCAFLVLTRWLPAVDLRRYRNTLVRFRKYNHWQILLGWRDKWDECLKDSR